MNSLNLSIILSIGFLLLFLICMFIWVMMLQHQMMQRMSIMDKNYSRSQLRTVTLLDKTISLLASADPLAFQQVQSLSPWSNPDEPEKTVGYTDIDEALRYAEEFGGVYDGEEDEFYDADRIRREFFEPDERPRFDGTVSG
jgi:hypothetical protein